MRSALSDLPDFLRREKPASEAVHFELPAQGISLEAVEKELILQALRKFDWNQTKAAAFLDMSRRTLIYRMEKYGFHKDAAEPSAGTLKTYSSGCHSTPKRTTSPHPSV